jgi:hypothetical protein
LQEFCKAKVC